MSDDPENHSHPKEEVALLRRRVAALQGRVDELERSERELRAGQEHLRLFVEHTPASIAMVDNEMRYLLVSRRWQIDYQVTEKDIIGITHYEAFPDIPEHWKAVHRRVLAGATEGQEEDPWERGDGNTQWVSWKMLPWHDASGSIGGAILFSEVVTERMPDKIALRETAEQLREINSRQELLIDVIREISTPVIPVHDGILVLPLVGAIDSTRSGRIMETLLDGVQKYAAEVVIIDITGVAIVDTAVADHLIQATRAATLLGAHCVLVGISPKIAQTLVQLGVDLGALVTRGNLQAGIDHALERQGRVVINRNQVRAAAR